MAVFWLLLIGVFFLLSGIPFVFWLIIAVLILSVALGIILYCLGYRGNNTDSSHLDNLDFDFISEETPKKKTHTGKCDGDCANCPPHYGYRYGRWYYGHDHVHGCQFGGNRCGGGMD